MHFVNMVRLLQNKLRGCHRKHRIACVSICSLTLIFILMIYGVFTLLMEKDFLTTFSYPYHGDIRPLVAELRANEMPSVPPINRYTYDFLTNITKCRQDLKFLYMVKSAAENRASRIAIRRTWGQMLRFRDVPTRTLFMVARSPYDKLVEEEHSRHGDIILMDFEDNYYNNTIKTMMGFRWAVEYCPTAEFYLFVDDDYYVSTRNLLQFVRNPTAYPEYLKLHDRETQEFELESNAVLYAGHRMFYMRPHRHWFSRWFITLDEYPFNYWPPYITAGAYVLSREALMDLYASSHYTKHFRFDDVYVGIMAYKMGIDPLHCGYFNFFRNYDSFEFTIASHGFDNPEELVQTWLDQKVRGFV